MRPTVNRSKDRHQLAPWAFRKPLAWDTPEIFALWKSFKTTGDKVAFDALVEHYLPIVRIMVGRLVTRKPDFYCEPWDDLISDGALALMDGIRRTTLTPLEFRSFAYRMIAREVQYQVRQRMPGKALVARRELILQDIRARLTQELQRVPSREEMMAELAPLLSNPNVVCEIPKRVSASRRNAKGRVRFGSLPDPTSPRPIKSALDAEAMKLAMKGLAPIDKKILRMVLRGDSTKAIAQKLGLSYAAAFRRVNGVLWERRSRAELAAYLGVEAVSEIPRGGKVRAYRPSRRRGSWWAEIVTFFWSSIDVANAAKSVPDER